MPTLNLQKKTKKETNQRNEHTPNRELRHKYYNTPEWKKLRETYIKEHPLCEDCLNEGKVVPAEDIHHIRSPLNVIKHCYWIIITLWLYVNNATIKDIILIKRQKYKMC